MVSQSNYESLIVFFFFLSNRTFVLSVACVACVCMCMWALRQGFLLWAIHMARKMCLLLAREPLLWHMHVCIKWSQCKIREVFQRSVFDARCSNDLRHNIFVAKIDLMPSRLCVAYTNAHHIHIHTYSQHHNTRHSSSEKLHWIYILCGWHLPWYCFLHGANTQTKNERFEKKNGKETVWKCRAYDKNEYGRTAV